MLEGYMIKRRSFLDILDRIYNDCWLIVKYQKVLKILKPGQLAGMRDMLLVGCRKSFDR
jgi:hypothetical protein